MKMLFIGTLIGESRVDHHGGLRYLKERRFISKNIVVAYIAYEIQIDGEERTIKKELSEELNSTVS